MPTFSTIQLETLLQPRSPPSSHLKQQQQQQILHEDELNRKKIVKPPAPAPQRRSPNHVFISPALYTTPQPTPILDSDHSLSGSLSPSPYVFNRKGRGPRGGSRPVEQEEEKAAVTTCVSDEIGGGVVDVNFDSDEIRGGGDGGGVVDEDFFDPRADSSASSVADSIDLNDFGRNVDCLSLVSNQGDFFDVDEEFFSDGSVSSVKTCGWSIESELRATRLSLFEEIEKRKIAEDALAMIQGLWQRVSSLLLHQTGLTFPVPPNNTGVELDISSLEQFSQEVIVARFVAEAIGKGEARAEAELAAEVIIESKDQEVSRLKDRLQYYEVMNHEMSQRNIEVSEVARRQRVKRRDQRKWLWSCLGISVVIGASVIAYSFLPNTNELPLLPASTSSDQTDSSSIISSQSS